MMMHCWDGAKANRPTFSQLAGNFGQGAHAFVSFQSLHIVEDYEPSGSPPKRVPVSQYNSLKNIVKNESGE